MSICITLASCLKGFHLQFALSHMHLPKIPGRAKHAALTVVSSGECSTQNGCGFLVSSQARGKDFPGSFPCSVKTGKLINTGALRAVKLMDSVEIF